MTNTDRETELLHEAGLEAAHFNSNAFVSQEFFHPIDGMEIRYEAVHNGQILRVKRHELAARIANLALIYYNHEGEGLEYFRSLRSLLRGAHFLNETISGKVDGFLSTYQINQIYAQSGCGLCLSAQEGAMYASIEYLLAGLPVVSTRSIGGREEFLDSYNCVFAEGNPESVRDTAAEIIRRKLDRHRIRRDAVERQDKVIAGFRAYVSSLISDYGELRDVSAYWKEIYVSKLLNWLPVDEFLGSFPKRGG